MKKSKKLLLFIGIIVCLIITVTAASTAFAGCSHNWVLAESGGTDCNGYWNLYVCSLCYESKQESTGVAPGHNWQVSVSETGTCERDGFITYYCTGCSELKTVTIQAPGHSYVYRSNNNATCITDGTKTGTCQRCSKTKTVIDVGSAKGHDFSEGWVLRISPTCQSEGESVRACSRCAVRETRVEAKTAHKDKNLDGKCDVCSASVSILPTPDDNDSTQQGDCSCNCHKGGIAGFFWKIGNFFNKLFRIKSKQICGCGVYHF